MTNEEKAKLLEKESRTIDRFGSSLTPPDNFADILREAAQVMRELDKRSLLTSPDWKTMYEAQERDMAALRKRVGELQADLATAGSNVHTLRDELRGAQQEMAADAMLIAEAQRGAEIVADTERRLERRIAELEAERDAAQAGAARAVEALTQGRVLAQEVVGETWDLAGSFTDKEQALFDWVEDLDFLRYPTTALDWLAQREREAAVRGMK